MLKFQMKLPAIDIQVNQKRQMHTIRNQNSTFSHSNFNYYKNIHLQYAIQYDMVELFLHNFHFWSKFFFAFDARTIFKSTENAHLLAAKIHFGQIKRNYLNAQTKMMAKIPKMMRDICFSRPFQNQSFSYRWSWIIDGLLYEWRTLFRAFQNQI